MKLNSSNEIYEQDGVFGDEDKFVKSSDRLNKMLGLAKTLSQYPTQILDIGGGTGYFSKLLKDLYPNSSVHCLDISSAALAEGKRLHPGIIFVQADAEANLPFEGDFFDLVISGEHIEHLKDVDTYLMEISRVMRKGATLILTTPNLASWFNRILLLFGKQPFYLEPSLKKTLPIFSYFGRTFPENLNALPSGHLRLFSFDMLKKLLKAYRFRLVSARGSVYFGKPIVRQFDSIISRFPSFASGLVFAVTK